MKTKTLALANGILGLVGGIFLLFGIWFILGVAATGVMTTFVYIVKIALLVLGIVGIAYYKGDERVGAAPSVLLIVGGAVSLTPFLGWIGGILAIIGGSLYIKNVEKICKKLI